VISGNAPFDGVYVSPANGIGDASGNVIQGNFIGTQADGISPLGNARNGVTFAHGAHDNVVGGLAAGAGNRIAFNNVGVFVGTAGFGFPDAAGDSILGNSIVSNTGLGIDLGGDGTTNNDPLPGDADAGPNNLQNFPVLTGVTASGGNTVITGRLNSLANTSFRIEFFVSDSRDPSGFGEGQSFLGSTNVTTDANGDASINFTATGIVPAGRVIAATTTRLASGSPTDTSEFSAAIYSLIMTNTADSGLGSLREAINSANTMANIDRTDDGIVDPDPITFTIPGAGVHRISPASALPPITDSVVIDGYTQPGAVPNSNPNDFNGTLLIELSGANAGQVAGLTITAGSSTVRGLVINGFQGQGGSAGVGIELQSGDGNHIVGNFIGTDPTGTLDKGNEDNAISFESGSDNNVIGGIAPAARNVISGSDRVALFIATSGNLVQGNFIGTRRDGISPLGNQQGVGFVGVG